MTPAWRGGRIRIGVSTPKKWNPLSPLIRKVMGTPYSHIWVLLEDALFDIDMMLGTERIGFVTLPYERFLEESNVIQVWDPDPSYKLEVGLYELVKRIGQPYDKVGLVGMGWVVALARWFKRKVRNPLASNKAMFCSEAVAYMLAKSAVPEAAMLVPERATPRDVVAVLDGMRAA
jgi:hypothetical protein